MNTNTKLTAIASVAIVALMLVPGASAGVGSRARHSQTVDDDYTLENQLWSGVGVTLGATAIVSENFGIAAGTYAGATVILTDLAACANGAYLNMNLLTYTTSTGCGTATANVEVGVDVSLGDCAAPTYSFLDGLVADQDTMVPLAGSNVWTTNGGLGVTALSQAYFNTEFHSGSSGCSVDGTTSLAADIDIGDNSVFG